MTRRSCKTVYAGKLPIGGGAPVSVQSMLNVPAADIAGSVRQAKALAAAGCQLIRAAVPNKDAVRLIAALKEAVDVPIVADIHFDYTLALEAVAAGVDKVRINPGNIGDDARVKAVADVCRAHKVPIRIGVNSGSLEKSILAKYGHPTAEALRDSALYHASLLERFDFDDIVISIKSSDVSTMMQACRLIAAACPYPLHLGVTEAGTKRLGLLKSAAGIGGLLAEGIGDTVRVSLTDDPLQEVQAGRELLEALGLLSDMPQLISCPTCGRTAVNLIDIAKAVEARLCEVHRPIKVAVMGCIVNGPGEASEADVGIAGGKGKVALFKKGQVLRTVDEKDAVEELFKEIMTLE